MFQVHANILQLDVTCEQITKHFSVVIGVQAENLIEISRAIK